MDLALLREVLRVEPYDGEYGTLTLRWKTVAANISSCFEMDIPHHSARDHYESMLETFKSSDRAQRLWGTGNEEAILEKTVPAIQAKKPRHIQLLQDLVDRREEKDEAKKAKKEKDQKRRDSLESTGSQLCLEAEQRVAKRQRTAGTAQKKDESDSTLQDLLDFEKQKHSEDHTYRMERLEFDKEEQKIRLVQMSESAKRNDQLERLLV
ncbi:hypothetical protein DYB25_008125 [Aphanomyces astaci]|uniref:Uncharacterized protein n=3 Tax=Aphanomyces astaci TaxID=112090 RepID=A0A396ZYC9_APHAT|nr:hypothetical protein DYB25_008125 [Aphanomyces astaci]RHY15510.1 hypothetical protein DYB36_004625 [Aphanomyces astaci]RHY44825.1 hypothetical protein DYB30_007161 [Aphanomyces astaci]RHY47487.1 hypothetical protein DYB34_005684 [Aphanomyces astaci]RHZ28973.1 hypothetical protein DYB31_008843 [Aphanomyces astaci]